MTPQKQSEQTKKGDSPKVLNFEASPEQVERGSAVTLRWKLGGGAADKVLLDGQAVQGTSCTRKPAEDPTIYTLVVTNAAGSDTHECAVGVHEQGDVVSGEFCALAADDEPTGQRHVHLVLEGAEGQHFMLEVAGQKFSGEVGADGVLDQMVPADSDAVVLVLSGNAQQTFTLNFGAMPPATTAMGLQARLNALGYEAGSAASIDARTSSALAEFQEQHDLEATGKPDGRTLKLLEKAYASR